MGRAERTARKTEQREKAEGTRFHFHTPFEARSYRWLTVVSSLLGPIGLILAWKAPGNWPLGIAGLVVGVTINVWYLRTWIRLCRRARPPVPRIHYLTGSAINPMTQRAFRQASVILRNQ